MGLLLNTGFGAESGVCGCKLRHIFFFPEHILDFVKKFCSEITKCYL